MRTQKKPVRRMKNRFDSAVRQSRMALKTTSGRSLLLAGVILLTGVLGYAYQVVMGRLLSPPDFAQLSSLLALIMFSASPLNAISMVLTRHISTLNVESHGLVLRRLYGRCHTTSFLVSLILVAIAFPNLNGLLGLLKLDDADLFWSFCLLMMLYSFCTVNLAFFQGLQRFNWLGGISFLTALLKVVLGIGLVMAGFGIIGAVDGLMISLLLTWMIGFFLLYRKYAERKGEGGAPPNPLKFYSVLPVLVSSIAFTAMTQLDMVFVNYFFPADSAGIYAAASVFGKAVLYIPGGIVMALFPVIAKDHSEASATVHLLKKGSWMTFGLCVFAALVYWIYGEELVGLFFGAQYHEAGILLRWYGFSILPLCLVSVAENYLIAKERVLFVWLILFVAPLELAAIFFFHDTLSDVIMIMAISGLLLVVTGYSIIYFDIRNARIR